MNYSKAKAKVIKFLEDKGYTNPDLTRLDDDNDCNDFMIYRWSFITEGVDYSLEFYTSDEEIDFYDCVNP